MLFRDGVTFWIGLSLRSGDFSVIDAVPLLILLLTLLIVLLIDSVDPFEAVAEFIVVEPPYLILELCENRGDSGEFVPCVLL